MAKTKIAITSSESDTRESERPIAVFLRGIDFADPSLFESVAVAIVASVVRMGLFVDGLFVERPALAGSSVTTIVFIAGAVMGSGMSKSNCPRDIPVFGNWPFLR